MRCVRLSLITVIVIMVPLPLRAGILFNRKKAAPERVPELLMALKADSDERHRADAALKLREFDTNAYPEIVPALADAAQNDPKSGVRAEALQSLARIRPVSQQARMAIEYAAGHDASLRVRVQAKSALLQYRVNGYHASKKTTPPERHTEEPPLAAPVDQPSIRPLTQTGAFNQSVIPTRTSGMTSPVIATPSSPLVPVAAPKLEPTPQAGREADGPDLEPPS